MKDKSIVVGQKIARVESDCKDRRLCIWFESGEGMAIECGSEKDYLVWIACDAAESE